MRTFRPGATLPPLLFLACILAGVAYLCFDRAASAMLTSNQRWPLVLFGSACVLYGPLAALVHLLRYFLTHVTVDPAYGLLIGGRRRVPWEGVRSIAYYPGPFQKALDTDLPAPKAHPTVKDPIVRHPLFFLIILPMYYIVFPVFLLLLPWQQRAVVVLKRDGRNAGEGQQLVFRDIADANELVRLVRACLSASVQSPRPASPAAGEFNA